MAPQINDLFGRYRLESILGQGSFGVVYRAFDTLLNRWVALKILTALGKDSAERASDLEREAKTLATINHSNVAVIYDFLSHEGQHAIVMEVVDGETLSSRLRTTHLSMGSILNIATQIASALEAAHEKGVIHRDLKPANIMVGREDSTKVLDFGLANQRLGHSWNPTEWPTGSDVDTHHARAMAGTVPYLAPECLRGEIATQQADIWSFGCVLFEVLATVRAFDGRHNDDVSSAIAHQEPAYESLPAGTPSAVLEVIQRCLRKNPRQRIQSAGDLRIRLEECVAGLNHGSVRADVPVAPPSANGLNMRLRRASENFARASERFGRNERQQRLVQLHAVNLADALEAASEHLQLGEIVTDYDDCSLLTVNVAQLGVGDELLGVTDWRTDHDWWLKDDAENFLAANIEALQQGASVRRTFVYDGNSDDSHSNKMLAAEMRKHQRLGIHVRMIDRARVPMHVPELRSQCVLGPAPGSTGRGARWLTYQIQLDAHEQPDKNVFSIQPDAIKRNERHLEQLWAAAEELPTVALENKVGSVRALREATDCSTVDFGRCEPATKMLSPDQLVAPGQNDGRRLYIHFDAFERLALRDRDAAGAILGGLVAVPIVRRAHHSLVQDAVMLYNFRATAANAIYEAITERWFEDLTLALRQIGHQPDRKPGRSNFTPLLGPEERVVATCMDSNYYTFATSEESSRRMFSDFLSLRLVHKLTRSGGDAYRDLTMLPGKVRLMSLRANSAAVAGAPSSYSVKPGTAVSTEQLREIKRQVFSAYEKDAHRILWSTVPDLTVAESHFLLEFEKSCLDTVARVVLRIGA